MRRRIAGALTLALLAFAAVVAADEVLVLKDGRRIPVTRLARRGGQVVFQTTRGEVFSVPEGDVVSPPLASIAADESKLLVLKDGRRITVTRLARRGGLVLFTTTRNEAFSVPEDQVVSPPLDSIPSLDAPAPAPSAPTTPAPSAPKPAPQAVEPEPAPAPAPATTAPPPPVAPRPASGEPEFVPLPDRWSIPYPDSPRLVKGGGLDPYNQSVLKGDRPVIGDSIFFVLGATLDLPLEVRGLPVGSGVSTANPQSLEFFGSGDQLFTTPRAFLSAELFRGQTAFRPRSWTLKVTGAFDLNHLRVEEQNLVNPDPREGRTRTRHDVALEEAYGELKLKDLSPAYDFVSLRAGIQPFVSDFRGFVFSDQNLGARLFGNAASNRWQYNAAFFELLEKETNSELNTFGKREQQVAMANVYRQDFLAHGYTLSLSYHWSRDHDSVHYDANDFLVRPAKVGSAQPHEVEAHYVGFAGDGHLGRINLSHAFYWTFGTDSLQPIEGRPVDVSASMAALELSVDRDWARLRLSGFFASGDDDPRDGQGQGFDSVYDNPNFAGGPFSFWVRSGIALTQTGVLLKAPGSLLPSLRSNKFEGQASYVNPGLLLFGAGLDLQLTPKLRASLNANYLRFDKTGSLSFLLFQPGLRKDVGVDLGGGLLYRPLLSENVVVLAGLAGLFSGAGFDDLYSSSCGVPGCSATTPKLYNGFVQLKLSF